eukprot:tig00022075_g23619.t1
MQIVINEQSKRKTAPYIAFHDGDRLFGDAAAQLRGRYPEKVITNAWQLLGQPSDGVLPKRFNSSVQYPFRMVKDASRGGVKFVIASGDEFSVEEIMAMVLSYARDLGQAFGKTTIRDCVLTVPPYFTQYERQALMDAANMANLKVLSLMHTGTAVGLHYGIDRDFPNATNVVFFDVGAGSIVATLATFNSKVEKDGSRNRTVGSMEIKGTAWNALLGAQDLDTCLADVFATQFETTNKKVGSLRKNARAMTKLRVEAERVKKVLSANSDAVVGVEAVTEDVDLRWKISRADFEEKCDAVFAKMVEPAQKLLKDAGLTPADIHAVEPFGGGTRIPKIINALQDFFKRDDITPHINTDEAAALGAGFRGAGLSPAFRVRKFILSDVFPFPIAVRLAAESDREKPHKRTVLFQANNKLESRKVMSWTRSTDFALEILYEAHPSLPRPEGIIAVANITGLPEALTKYNHSKKEPVKVNVQFTLTRSGLVMIEKAEVSLVEEVTVVITPSPSPTPGANATASAANATAAAADNSTATADAPSSEEEASKPPAEEGAESGDDEAATPAPSATPEAAKKEKDEKKDEKKDEQVKTKTFKKYHKVTLKVKWNSHNEPYPLTDAEFKTAVKRLGDLADADRLKKEREDAKNAVEAFVYEAKEKLSAEGVEAVTTEAQREAMIAALDAAESWLYDDGAEATTAQYKAKLAEIRKEPDAVQVRIAELTARPKAFAECREAVNLTRTGTELLATDAPHITEEARAKFLNESVDRTEKWCADKEAEQEKKAPHETPAVLSSEIAAKTSDLIYRFRVLKNTPKPKPKVEKANATAAKNGTKEEAAEEDEEEDEEAEDEQEGPGAAGKKGAGEAEGAGDGSSSEENARDSAGKAGSAEGGQGEGDADGEGEGEGKKDEL